jgi:hypothetical protein
MFLPIPATKLWGWGLKSHRSGNKQTLPLEKTVSPAE